LKVKLYNKIKEFVKAGYSKVEATEVTNQIIKDLILTELQDTCF
jgi:hypothetical protein